MSIIRLLLNECMSAYVVFARVVGGVDVNIVVHRSRTFPAYMITRAIIWCCGVGRTFETEGHSAPPGHGREGQEGEARGAGAPFSASTSQFDEFVLGLPRFSHFQSATSSGALWLCFLCASTSTASFPPQCIVTP